MPITINIVLPPSFDIGPNLQQLGVKIVAELDDLQNDLQAKLTDLQASGEQTTGVIVTALQAKHDQVMAAITKLQTDLQAALGSATDPASFQRFKDAMGTSFDQAKSNLQTKQDQIMAAIQGVDQPDVVPPTPTPGPTPPTPAPEPTPAPIIGPDVPPAPDQPPQNT